MCILGKDRLMELIERYRVIHPFDPELLDGDGYVLTVREDVELKYLEHRNLVSSEIVFTPPDVIALLTAKSRFGRLGLCFLQATKVHSCWIGRLVLEMVNLSNEREPIVVKKGEPFVHIIFLRRKGEPAPYVGKYIFQEMSQEEIREYQPILREAIPDFDEVEKAWSRELRRSGRA